MELNDAIENQAAAPGQETGDGGGTAEPAGRAPLEAPAAVEFAAGESEADGQAKAAPVIEPSEAAAEQSHAGSGEAETSAAAPEPDEPPESNEAAGEPEALPATEMSEPTADQQVADEIPAAVPEPPAGEPSDESAEQQSEPEQPEAAEAVPAGLLLPFEVEPPIAPTSIPTLKAMLEAIIYVTEEPLSSTQFATALGQPPDLIEQALEELVAEYDRPERGLTIREVAGGYKMATKAEHHEAVRAFVKKLKPPLKLSLAALETLAVVAYKQPVTAPEIMEVRGVQGAGVLKTLLDRKLIAAAGRKNVIGKPILYKTTKEFLLQFGLKDLAELPSLKEFEELRRLAVSDVELDAGATNSPEPSSPPVEAAETEPVPTPDPLPMAGETAAETATAEPAPPPQPTEEGTAD